MSAPLNTSKASTNATAPDWLGSNHHIVEFGSCSDRNMQHNTSSTPQTKCFFIFMISNQTSNGDLSQFLNWKAFYALFTLIAI